MSARLDWTDPAAVSTWLAGLRQSFGDADAVTSDMLRPPRERELGPALHREHYQAAREQILSALAYASPEPDDGPANDNDRGDPAGMGGAGGAE